MHGNTIHTYMERKSFSWKLKCMEKLGKADLSDLSNVPVEKRAVPWEEESGMRWPSTLSGRLKQLTEAPGDIMTNAWMDCLLSD